MRFATNLASATALMMTLAPPSGAQSVSELHFDPGNYGTMVSGTITGQEYADYKLAASAGQEMYVSLEVADTNGIGTIYFNILPPGSDGMAIYNGSKDGNTTTIDLPESGDYAIRLYLMGNDEGTGKTVGFNMDLSIQ